MCTAAYFAEWTRSPELGFYEGLDAFASYAVFARASTGEIECVRADEQFGAHIDRVM